LSLGSLLAVALSSQSAFGDAYDDAYASTIARVQVSPWLGAGGGWRTDGQSTRPLFLAGAGVDGTFAVATLFRPPTDDNGGSFQLRAGPWIEVNTPLDRVRGEGGLSLIMKQTRFAAWGTFGLRLGAGDSTLGVPDLVGVLSWGVWGEDSNARIAYRDGREVLVAGNTVGLASGMRLFVAVRRDLDPLPATEVAFGIELEPTWLLPPYTRQKWLRH
jgi:hypothetical protein